MPRRAVRSLLVVAVLTVVILAIALGRERESTVTAEGADPLAGRVTRVVDGDTLHVALPSGDETVRVIGIDTPEVQHDDAPAACYGDDTAEWVRARLEGRTVRLRRGVEEVDRFGRSLAGVAVLDGPLAGRDLARAVAAAGLARPLPIEPNTADAPAIDAAVRQARQARRGLWGACGFALAFPGRG